MAARLRDLLQRSREVKPKSTIEPPLQVSELVADNEEIIGPISSDKEAHNNAIETAAKDIFYTTLVGSENVTAEHHLTFHRALLLSTILLSSQFGTCSIFYSTVGTEV